MKHNQELESGAPDLERLNRLVMGNLVRHPVYRAGALPLHVASPLYARYHVSPVTRGERLVAVTWVQSLVRDAARRELLHGLNAAREKLLQSAPEAEETAHVNAAYLNLIRMWSDI